MMPIFIDLILLANDHELHNDNFRVPQKRQLLSLESDSTSRLKLILIRLTVKYVFLNLYKPTWNYPNPN